MRYNLTSIHRPIYYRALNKTYQERAPKASPCHLFNSLPFFIVNLYFNSIVVQKRKPPDYTEGTVSSHWTDAGSVESTSNTDSADTSGNNDHICYDVLLCLYL